MSSSFSMPGGESSFKTTEKPAGSIKIGNFLLLKGRPCKIIRISSGGTQLRYTGTDVFTKQLFDDTSFTPASGSEPAARVLDFKTWRITDVANGLATAKNEEGDVMSGVQLADENNLFSRMLSAVNSGEKEVYGLVLEEGGNTLIVDMKV